MEGSELDIFVFGSNIYYINDRLDKRTWTYIFGACCATTVFIPSFHNYRMWSFLGLGMTTYTAWYLAIAALINGQVRPRASAIPAHPFFFPTIHFEVSEVSLAIEQQ
jgi:auxin influx carrier (AUX1 LAX family)